MLISDLLKETSTALLANKSRSGLTILGIVIGIASVIAMVSIGQGASGQIQASIESLGSNLLMVMPGVIQPGRGIVSSGRGAAQTLKNPDIEVLKNIEGVARVSPELQRRFQVVAPNGKNTNTTITGVTPDFLAVRNFSLKNGSFITESHLNNLAKVAVLGATVAEDLFGSESEPVGKTIRINKINFKVIGVLNKKGGSGFANPDDIVLVPLTTMQKILAGVDYLSMITLSVQSKDLMPQVQEAITIALAEKHRVDLQNPDFSVLSQAEISSALTQVTNTFTIFLAAVAGISLLVGGIGIMNMMLTTVTERTREIGLRKAIGAKRKDISLQFLAESIFLTLIGGGIGIILGWLASLAISKLANIQTSVSLEAIILAVGVSGAIGIIFGYWPAQKAAKLNPIEALRYE